MDLSQRERTVRFAAAVALVINVTLSSFKLMAGIWGHSRAVVADAIHSLSDMATDVAVLVGSRLWSQPRDGDHPYGHGRIEIVVTAVIGLVLAAVAVGIGYEAVASIHERHAQTPGCIALIAAFVSIVVKEWLYRWTVGVGRRVRSSATVANAWHHRSDALSSIPAVLAVGVAMLLPAWQFIDHIGAVMVCLIILQAAYMIVRPALGQLIDTGLPAADRQAMLEAVLACPGVQVAHDLRTRDLGAGVAIDLHVEVEPALTVAEGHAIAEAVRRRLHEDFPDVVDVVVHVDPRGYEDPALSALRPLHGSGGPGQDEEQADRSP